LSGYWTSGFSHTFNYLV